MPVILSLRTAIIALFLIVTTVAPSLADGFDYTARTGIVYLDKAGAPLFEIPSTDAERPPLLEVGTTVNVVTVGFGGVQRLVQAKTAGAAIIVPPGDDRLALDGANGDTARYKLAIIGDAELRPGAVGFGLAGVADGCKASETVVSCDLEPDGPPLFFRVCASREGLHYSVWSGKPLEGARRWRAYYYLGYDVEPDCTERDFSD